MTDLTIDQRGPVLVLTINRPEARNAINSRVTIALGEALEHADSSPDVRVVVLTGAGDISFCAGADLKELADPDAHAAGADARKRWGFAAYVRHAIATPTIAAVNGLALGGGTELVLASDLAIAADHAEFGLPEVRRGIYAGGGGAIRLGRQLPSKIAMDLLLTGRRIDAQRALELGLINRVVPREDLLDAALDYAGEVAANAPLAVQTTKRIARAIEDGRFVDEADDWRRDAHHGRTVLESEDMREGIAAFAEKREPRWSAR